LSYQGNIRVSLNLNPRRSGGSGVAEQGIKSLLIRPKGIGLGAVSDDGDPLDSVALANGVHYILTLNNPAKNRMPSVQPGGRHMGDEELATVGSRT
jgi:hypothetical protein